MSKFVVVNEAPQNLSENEHVIYEPNFLDEIKNADKFTSKLGKSKVTTVNHLKSIMENIRINYDPEGFDVIGGIPYSKYEGLPYESHEDLSEVVVKILKKHKPEIINKCLDKKIKSRPESTELVYFVGSEDKTQPFIANGVARTDAPKGQHKTIKKEDNAN